MNKNRLVSEVNPLGPFTGGIFFEPTGLLSQYSKQYGRPDYEKLLQHFSDQLKIVCNISEETQTNLTLRDHNHNEYMSKELHNNGRPLIDGVNFYKKLWNLDLTTRSIVTVRHPLDSYLGCLSKGWVKKIDESLDTYSARYLKFLDDYSEMPIFKYEDICSDPIEKMTEICTYLEIPFDPDFVNKFHTVRLTGDSGRTSTDIGLKPRRDIPEQVKMQIETADHYIKLCERLNYTS